MPELLPRLSPKSRASLGWLLAPVLAVLAIGVQDLLDVPKGEMLEKEPPELVGDAGKPKRPKGKSKGKSKAKSKQGNAYVPREDAARQALRDRWSQQELDSEPTDQNFRRHHEALLRAIVTRLRADVLGDGKSAPMQIRPSCKSIRCALELCGDQALVSGIAARLGTITVDGASLWHALSETEAVREPPKRDARQNQQCRRWLVDFAVEGAAIGELELGDEQRETDTDTGGE